MSQENTGRPCMNRDYNVEIVGYEFFDCDELIIPKEQLFMAEEDRVIPPRSGIVIDWVANVGWGQLTIEKYEDGHIEVDSEHMSPAFVAQVMDAFKNEIVAVVENDWNIPNH